MVSIVVRTVLIYVLVSVVLKVMGKRQIGELDVSELVSTLLISELAAIPIDDPDIPLLNAVIPIILLLCIEIIVSTVKNKSERLKDAVEGKPVYIIYKGRLIQEALFKNRISVNELLSELRIQGIGNIKDVEYAIVEQNGSLSVIKKDGDPMAHAVVIDGSYVRDTMEYARINEKFIKDELEKRKTALSDVLIMTVSDDKKINVIKKDGSF